jgi:hypothetical protein
MKVSGWKRIGIILSAVWVLGGFVKTFLYLDAEDNRMQAQSLHLCYEYYVPSSTNPQIDTCDKPYVDNRRFEFESAAAVAVVPVPLAWGFVYLILFLIRWVKRGFAVTS